ncbi:hypothetical protein, conserved [Trypanosoma cruzi]|uniref:Thioredoxin domain-containing protein n=2 Tax=Trypanosoma cruzi TaxID=5693 RepID=Q4DJW8_TRYCC|nr:hypothetical protein, conserved [Trypanosoma cruzi]EAN92826.1 hypothetical protein, conserved [Trypanosoma cruzi]|eukprot:XP_814677.1 hypothetical protein [Trypanosoma cruzi strain CL Brener]
MHGYLFAALLYCYCYYYYVLEVATGPQSMVLLFAFLFYFIYVCVFLFVCLFVCVATVSKYDAVLARNMMRLTRRCLFITKISKISRPPASGYEIAELPNEKVFMEFLKYYNTKCVLAVLHSGSLRSTAGEGGAGTKIVEDPLTRSFISSINAMNMGNPNETKLALVPGPHAPRMVEEYGVLTYPTVLLFMNGKCVERVVGARTREVSIKALFTLRNAGRNIFSRE